VMPLHGLGVILRHTLACLKHGPESELSRGLTLLGQGTQQPQGRRLVAALVSGNRIVERTRNRHSAQAKRNYENREGNPECVLHDWMSPRRTRRKSTPILVPPSTAPAAL
jgi:hypothetical protein